MKKIKERQFLDLINGSDEKMVIMKTDLDIHNEDIICINLCLDNDIYMGISILVRVISIWSVGIKGLEKNASVYIVERICDTIYDRYGVIKRLLLE